MPINEAAARMQRSGTREIMDRAWGRPGVIRLEVVEPNLPTPVQIVVAAHAAALDGQTGYTPAAPRPPASRRCARR